MYNSRIFCQYVSFFYYVFLLFAVPMELDQLSRSETGCVSSGSLTNVPRSYEPVPVAETPPPYETSELCSSSYEPAPPVYSQQINPVSLLLRSPLIAK